MTRPAKYWTHERDDLLRKTARAGWSVHMIAAQLEMQPFEVETRAEMLGIGPLPDRLVGATRCEKCDRCLGVPCPYSYKVCPRTKPFEATR